VEIRELYRLLCSKRYLRLTVLFVDVCDVASRFRLTVALIDTNFFDKLLLVGFGCQTPVRPVFLMVVATIVDGVRIGKQHVVHARFVLGTVVAL
jgi:hypothetical protein